VHMHGTALFSIYLVPEPISEVLVWGGEVV